MERQQSFEFDRFWDEKYLWMSIRDKARFASSLFMNLRSQDGLILHGRVEFKTSVQGQNPVDKTLFQLWKTLNHSTFQIIISTSFCHPLIFPSTKNQSLNSNWIILFCSHCVKNYFLKVPQCVKGPFFDQKLQILEKLEKWSISILCQNWLFLAVKNSKYLNFRA